MPLQDAVKQGACKLRPGLCCEQCEHRDCAWCLWFSRAGAVEHRPGTTGCERPSLLGCVSEGEATHKIYLDLRKAISAVPTEL